MPNARFIVTTANAPGAIAVIQIVGPESHLAVKTLCGVLPGPRCKLVSIADLDEMLILTTGNDGVWLMPHGGLRVVQKLTEQLIAADVQPLSELDPCQLYPEAVNRMEAAMCHTLAGAVSPAAVDLLIRQPNCWQQALNNSIDWQQILDQSHRLNCLIRPPVVVLMGHANVGKSTLTNLLLGDQHTITADQPGTTRDWTGHLLTLPCPFGPLAVHWHDTPGRRETDDRIEQHAIALSNKLLEQADLIIGIGDLQHDLPNIDLPEDKPRLHLLNKIDLAEPQSQTDHMGMSQLMSQQVIPVSALDRATIDTLGHAVAQQMGLNTIDPTVPWAFCPALEQLVESQDMKTIAKWLQTTGPSDQTH